MDLKPRKIENWEHAIDLTIARHDLVISGHYPNYVVCKLDLRPNYWKIGCPLCEYLRQQNVSAEFRCNWCLWIKFTGYSCVENCLFNYGDNKESIIRLKAWKKELK